MISLGIFSPFVSLQFSSENALSPWGEGDEGGFDGFLKELDLMNRFEYDILHERFLSKIFFAGVGGGRIVLL